MMKTASEVEAVYAIANQLLKEAGFFGTAAQGAGKAVTGLAGRVVRTVAPNSQAAMTGLGHLARHQTAVGGAALGLGAVGAAGGGVLAGRMTAPKASVNVQR